MKRSRIVITFSNMYCSAIAFDSLLVALFIILVSGLVWKGGGGVWVIEYTLDECAMHNGGKYAWVCLNLTNIYIADTLSFP